MSVPITFRTQWAALIGCTNARSGPAAAEPDTT